MEFLAGISVGILMGILIGLFLPEIARRSNPDYMPRSSRQPEPEPPRQLAEPQPMLYHPPIIVLAAPMERVEQRTTALQPRR
jgi:hypothetical protein